MDTDDHFHSDTEVVGVDGNTISEPLLSKRGNRKNARFNIPVNPNDDNYFEITDDSVAVNTAGGADVEDPELAKVAKGLEKRPSFGASVVRNASSRIRQVSEALTRLTTLREPVGQLDRSKSAAAYAMSGLKFISKNESNDAAWVAVEKRFDDKATDELLPRSHFCECIGMKKVSKEFACELFDALSRRRNIRVDMINKAQLKEFWDLIFDDSFDSRLQTFFDMVDKDGDGMITEDELKKIIILSASANNLSRIKEQADIYAAMLMEELDPDKVGYIMIEQLEMMLVKAQRHNVREESRKLMSRTMSRKLDTKSGNLIRGWYEDFKYFLQDNWQRCWVIVLWIGVMVGLFTWKYIQYKDRAVYKVLGPCVCIAKGAAETLKLNMALILLPVCRNTITWLRNKTKLGVVVPFDDNLNFHMVIAVAISIGVGLHAISHLTCDFPRLIHATEEEYKPMQQFFGDQPKNYWHFLKETEGYTGIIMLVLMMIAFTLASPWLRRNKLKLPIFLKKLTGFNAFWYSHHLFVVVYTLLIVHGIKLYLSKEWYKKTTWMYLAVPISLYALERLIRVFRSSVKHVEIINPMHLPGKVLALQMSKPEGFEYKSGQYMFVKCPVVSPFEWHPFSITSAPGDDYLSVHIRTLGDWTGEIKRVFLEASQPPTDGKSGLLRADGQEEKPKYPRVVIDGPYGAPAQDYKNYEVVLLVGLGIGATPMISIVKDIVHNLKAKEKEDSALENGVTGSGIDTDTNKLKKNKPRPRSLNNFRTTRAYFYWVTCEDGTFDWFKGAMNEAAEMDKKGVIEMNNYCSSVFEEGDARSALITMLQSINHAKSGVDVVADTRVKTHFAKPNWHEVYKHVALKHSGSKIGVFYCGAPAPAKELEKLAHDFSHNKSTNCRFDFHKENF